MDSNPGQVRSEALGQFWQEHPRCLCCNCVMAQGVCGSAETPLYQRGDLLLLSHFPNESFAKEINDTGIPRAVQGLHQDLALRNALAGES